MSGDTNKNIILLLLLLIIIIIIERKHLKYKFKQVEKELHLLYSNFSFTKLEIKLAAGATLPIGIFFHEKYKR